VLIGNFMEGSPTDAAIASLCDLLAWKAQIHRIDPIASEPFINLVGDHRVFPNIAAHRQTGMTLCPGNRLFKRMDAIRAEVQRRVGNFPPLTIDMSRATTYVSTGQSTKKATASNLATKTTGAAGPGLSVPIGYRILATDGTVVSFAGGGSPAIGRASNALGLTHTSAGWFALDRAGQVTAFDGATSYGDLKTISGKGSPVDIAATPTGAGYWILTKEGGVFAFGDAVDAGSPRRLGAGAASVRIHSSPSGKGYWVLGADGRLRGFGDAAALGAATGLGGNQIDFATTSSGAGAWVLSDNGTIAAVGNAKPLGDLATIGSRWSHPAVGILASQDVGYLVLTHNGGLYAFGKAPFLGSAAGAGLTAAGIAGVF
jgi:hypothetical protein